MKFPYGISDFHKIMTEDYFYVDRTDRIPVIEDTRHTLLFLRPRRFGKSLLLSMLENYYDVAKLDQFEVMFGGLDIGQDPTPLCNQYYVMRWDFSAVDPQGGTGQIRRVLHQHINDAISEFQARYQSRLQYEIKISAENAHSSFHSLLTAVKMSPHRLYLFIDEYDNFANEVLISDKSRYKALVQGEGALKSIFKMVKFGLSGQGLDRVFIAGVSPIALSDMTSGFNIATNIYLDPKFNDLCGFTESEIMPILQTIVKRCGLGSDKADEALSVMRAYYNSFRFSYYDETHIYNPTLVLYFLDTFQNTCRYPDELLDENLAMDRSKLRYIAGLPEGGQLLLDLLNDNDPLTIYKLSRRFGVEDVLHERKDRMFMGSLLYYFGILTLVGYSPMKRTILRIPNQVARGLYLERIQKMILPESDHASQAQVAGDSLYLKGDMQLVCDFIENSYYHVFSNRDYRWANELTVKTLFLTVLYNDMLYSIESEPALQRRYADLAMIRRPDAWDQPFFDVLIEFKYVKLKRDGKAELSLSQDAVRNMSYDELFSLKSVQEKLASARPALANYAAVLQQKYGDGLHLRRFTVVSIGFERLVWEETTN
ncbi:MAG: hypothetical protein B6244_00715 [Candidatus Cloacimonetes bacterium 4572_55]|nr:MAG: hypothetical protein B6244_00715 [Candidatus Cloacimonetes bacterium 4572_55]